MHDVLRQRLMRSIESLPDEQVYQVLDYIEFLESKYARDLQVESSTLQKLAEGLEDRIRKKAVNPATLREAFQLISTADKVLSSVSSAGRQIITELGTLGEPVEREAPVGPERPDSRKAGGDTRAEDTGSESPERP